LAALAATERELEERRTTLDSLPKLEEPSGPTVADLRVEIASLEADYRQKRGNAVSCRDRVTELTRKLAELDGQTECPYCGATGDSWKATKAAELAMDLHNAEEAAVKAEKSQETVKEASKAKGVQIAAAKDAEQRQAGLASQRTALERQIASLETAVAAGPAYRDELSRLPAAPSQNWDDELADLRQRKADLLGQIGTIRDAMTAAAQRQADRKRLAQAEAQRDDAKAELAAVTATADALRVILADSVERAFRPMLEAANGFAAQVLPTPLAYNREKNELGTVRAGIWIGHRTFSGTEKAVAYAAIQAALASASPLRVMIIDELGRLRNKHVRALFAAVKTAISAGRIDQFVGCGAYSLEEAKALVPPPSPGDDCSFHLVEVGSTVPAAAS
jgi:DNA repair exonuclease SbcCD ATPase subunit